MKIGRYILFFLFLTVEATLLGNQIIWLSTDYDLGTFPEEEGQREGIFKFINRRDSSVFINQVKPGCGCTSTTYTKEMIHPGDTAYISFSFDPEGRPGEFEKNIRVTIGNDNQLFYLKIKGNVKPSQETLSRHYPYVAGDLRYDVSILPFGEMKKGTARHKFVNLFNQGNDTIIPKAYVDSKAMELSIVPDTLPPGGKATLGVYFKTESEHEFGPISRHIRLTDNRNQSGEESLIEIRANISPSNDLILSDDPANAPAAILIPQYVDMGEDVMGVDIPFEFKIYNPGGTELKIYNIYSISDHIKINKIPKSVKKGKTGVIKGILKGEKLTSAPFRIEITVLTNDPIRPEQTVNVVGSKL